MSHTRYSPLPLRVIRSEPILNRPPGPHNQPSVNFLEVDSDPIENDEPNTLAAPTLLGKAGSVVVLKENHPVAPPVRIGPIRHPKKNRSRYYPLSLKRV